MKLKDKFKDLDFLADFTMCMAYIVGALSLILIGIQIGIYVSQ